MREAINLESIYTNVQLLDEQEIYNFETVEALEQAFRKSQSRRFQTEKSGKRTGIEVAKEHQYLMVLGSSGAGKSTFLRRMGLEALKGRDGELEHQYIPVFIELKRFTSNKINIKQKIAQEFSICGFPSSDKFTTQALDQGKLLILLDGLDEVPTQNLNQIINQIEDFVDQYSQNRFIASCRVAAYRSSFRRFRDVVMADFDDTQIQQFINNWFQSEGDRQGGTAKKCWETLQKPENSSAKELAHTPLLLTFLCLIYNRSQDFPKVRSSLYGKVLKILLEEWAAEKKILQDNIYQELNTGLEEALLSEIAYSGFKIDRLFFYKRDIVEQIKTFIVGNPKAPQHLDGEAVLNAITVQQGVLVERAENIYSFSHLTLQEYLTAQYIDDQRLIQQLVTEHLTDQRWREVFLLVAGLMRGGADELLLLMEEQAQQYTKNPKLQALLNWADQATAGSASNLKPVAKRAIANAIANAIVNAKLYADPNLHTKLRANVIANANANFSPYASASDKISAIANDIANAQLRAITNANANANAIAYAITNINTNARAIAIAIVMVIVVANDIANGILDNIDSFLDFFIAVVQDLEKLPPVFTKVNFPLLTARLKALKTEVPTEKQPKEVHSNFAKRLIETWPQAFNLTPELIDFSREELKEEPQSKFAKHLIKTWLQAFNLTPELIDFSREELKEIVAPYFYINYLILQCKQAAVRVSPQTWEGIEERMLKVPEPPNQA